MQHEHLTTSCRVLAIGALWLLSSVPACAINADYEATAYRCDGSGQCPDGQTCQAGVCRSQLVEEPLCGTLAAAPEDFTSVDLDVIDWMLWSYWSDAPEYMSVTGGQLVFNFPADVGDVGASFGTQEIYALQDSAATVEVIELSVDDTMFVSLDLRAQDNRHMHLYYAGGSLHMEYDSLVESMELATVPYDAGEHRFWRIRELDGAIRWDTSPDGISWTEHASITTATIADFGPWVGASVEAWKDVAGQQAVSVVMDNLNVGQGDVGFCASASLQDDFEDGLEDTRWDIKDSGVCAVVEQDGRLGFEFPEVGMAECYRESWTLYDLSNSTITVEAPLMDVPGMEQCLKLFLDGNSQDIEFELRDGDLRGEKSLNSGSDTVFALQFDPSIHRWWRFRGDGGAVYWEVSTDRVDWQLMASHQSPPLDLSHVAITLVGDTNTGLIENVGASFDNLNVPAR